MAQHSKTAFSMRPCLTTHPLLLLICKYCRNSPVLALIQHLISRNGDAHLSPQQWGVGQNNAELQSSLGYGTRDLISKLKSQQTPTQWYQDLTWLKQGDSQSEL